MSDHDHSNQPKVWCITHQYEHISTIPRFTYACKDCGWGQWYQSVAREHAQEFDHETYEVEHVMVPLDGLEREHVAALRALAESRARFADSEARKAELEAAIQRAREAAQPTANGEPLRERVIEALDCAPSLVLEDRDREVAARACATMLHEWRVRGEGDFYGWCTVWWQTTFDRAAAIRKGEHA